MTIWNNLLGNLAVVAICTSLWTFGSRRFTRLHRHASSLALGIIMASGAACVMLLPFQFMPGIFLDLRYTFIGISAFFGGPIAVVLPVISALLMRIWLGGTGVVLGVTHILLTAISCLVLWRITRTRQIPMRTLGGVAATVCVSGTTGFFFAVPFDRWGIVFPTVLAPFTAALFVSTAIAGMAILQERRRMIATDENRIYRAIIEALPDCLNAKDLYGRFVAANPATAHLMQASSVSALLGKSDADFYPSDIAAGFRAVELDLMQQGKPLMIEQKFKALEGHETWLATLKAPIFDEWGKIAGVVTHNRDITQQKAVELELATAQARLADAVSSMADGMAMFDARGTLLFRNERYLELFPLTADIRDVGSSLKDVLRLAIERGEDQAVSGCSENTVERTYASLMSAGTRQFRLADGRWIEARTRQCVDGGAMIVFTDVSVAKQTVANLTSLNSHLAGLATTDALTGLANRRAFDTKLNELTRSATKAGEGLALLMIDVDRFKSYNDTYGHPAGDACLQVIAERLAEAAAAHPDAMVARYGGEEIAVILPRVQTDEGLQIATQLCEAVRARALPHSGSEKGIVTVSIGVASLSHGSGRRSDDLLKDADAGLYNAKALGRDQVQLAHQSEASLQSA
jgi:diguanylate cyclase (GGDEF)-like protein/PAS domain S-box-containing protein